MRTLDAPLSTARTGTNARVREMGQELFNPPNVKGWPEGKTWMNTMTLLARVNFASRVIAKMNQQGIFSDNLHSRPGRARDRRGRPGDAGPDRGRRLGRAAAGPRPLARRRARPWWPTCRTRTPPARRTSSPRRSGLMSLMLSVPEYHLA